MSKILSNLKYTKDHEWANIQNDEMAIIGITDYAQSALGDIVFVELPEIGRKLNAHESFGVVESIKSVSDLYSPLTGEVLEVNTELLSSPELCNSSPYEKAWMIKLKIENLEEKNTLLNSDAYSSLLH